MTDRCVEGAKENAVLAVNRTGPASVSGEHFTSVPQVLVSVSRTETRQYRRMLNGFFSVLVEI